MVNQNQKGLRFNSLFSKLKCIRKISFFEGPALDISKLRQRSFQHISTSGAPCELKWGAGLLVRRTTRKEECAACWRSQGFLSCFCCKSRWCLNLTNNFKNSFLKIIPGLMVKDTRQWGAIWCLTADTGSSPLLLFLLWPLLIHIPCQSFPQAHLYHWRL